VIERYEWYIVGASIALSLTVAIGCAIYDWRTKRKKKRLKSLARLRGTQLRAECCHAR
jgi:hypothetical protein